GPGGFTSTEQNPTVNEAGTYTLTVTGANGCTSTATAVVELDNQVPGAQASGGELDCATHSTTLHATGNGSFLWTGPNGFSSTEQDPVVVDAGTYTLVVTGSNGCTSSDMVTLTEPECGSCDTPIIISCPEPVTVECGEAYDPWTIGLPVIRKDKDCPEVIYFNYEDMISTGECTTTVTRHWTFRDEDGNEETCNQTILITDTQAPVLMNVPEDITIVCGPIPALPKDVWAEDCKDDVSVVVTEVSTPADADGNYTITRTFSATDGCTNTASATQVITMIACKTECEAPIIISCAPSVVTLPCGSSIDPEDIGYPATRKDEDCPTVNYYNYMDYTYSGQYVTTITRHWTFRDEAGNEETCDQTIYLTGCGWGISNRPQSTGIGDPVALSGLSVTPNPFRHDTRINFTSEMDGKAVVIITDLAGHQIATLFEGQVAKGERKSLEWKPGDLEGGLYFYRITLNGYPTMGKIAYRP
ncbi:MAG: T9SS type A sorting domain-containing protein, partial [Flavobacteriia bacterium]|nr:T9SS type A sorting domain-containing protein [Flavobacteriia bacterium]